MLLPEPQREGKIFLEEAIRKRKSRRRFSVRSLTAAQLSQLIWAAKKIPSAGALYPLELYAVIGKDCVEGADAGVYRCEIGRITLHKPGDLRLELASACLHQMFIAEAPVSFVIAAEYERTTRRYGERGIRYVLMEVGHAGQNIYLQCEALGLGTVAIGAFYDDEVSSVLNLPKMHRPLYVMPVGYAREL
ncbi:SagB/ThcOx family dehydrogenase [Candidatus Alkanophaga liquidiphilum]|nr:Nitroreductase [Candidatus Alkanophaga liquidiphilum]RLG38555.1 MAG: nitroreductase [Candidatus Alkanophagales archaeon]